jgi:hypothetical protein
VASVAATAAAAGPPVGSMVGASAVAAVAGWSTVGDDFAVAVAAGVGASAVGLGWELSSSTVGAVAGAATCSLVVAALGGGGWLTLLSTRMK